MLFTRSSAVTTALFSLVSTTIGLPQVNPSGTGRIDVYLFGDTQATGCLTSAAQWTTDTDLCATIQGDGDGGISGSGGAFTLANGVLTTGNANTNWTGTLATNKQNVTNLQVVVTDGWSITKGGWLWYGQEIPQATDSIDVSSTETKEHGITLFFVPT